jgi:hypothetical protein
MPQSHGPASAWIEFNIPAREDERARLLLDLVDPLVHRHFAGCVKTWFYFWEPELRLRILWADAIHAESARAKLAGFLDRARADDKIEDW